VWDGDSLCKANKPSCLHRSEPTVWDGDSDALSGVDLPSVDVPSPPCGMVT